MRRFFTLVSILALAAAAPAAAYQESGPVVHVADGDTFDVDLGTTERIRLLGVNANEIGECHAATATARLTQLIDGKTVTLEADDPNVQLRGRLARWVSTGSTDVGEILLREGLALLFPHPTETARLDDYRAAAAVGRASGQGLWNSDACGIGPSQNADISVNLRWDAEGNDQTNINGEWIDIVNRSNSALSLNGWQVRDSALSFYEFPPAASVPSNGYLRVHIGEGSDTPTKLYWGLSDPLFDNSVGDGAFLLDPDGDIRASFEYPCAGSCTDPRGVDLSMEVNYDAPGDDQVNPNGEWVKIKNTGGAAIDLFGLAVVTYPYAYHFELGDSLGAEQVLTIYVGQGSDSTLTRYWGKSSGILDNGGDRIGVERSDGV
ncbi:MAG: lamin tail domain-containing protein, partial [Actinomycetota bacterium]|nr:lamin tail domain-containing protein [Actinomycetota bacterium]